MSLERVAPRNKLVWTATALGANFGGYFGVVRPSLTPAPPWVRLFEYVPGPTDTPATFEAQHTVFYDYEAGWGGPGPWAVGWDYEIRVLNRQTGFYSRVGGAKDVRNPLTADATHWLTSNVAPYLNCAVDNKTLDGDQVQDPTDVHPGFLGRHGTWTRTRMERAGQRFKLDWDYFGPDDLSFERLRWPFSIASTGRQVALLVPSGDRVLGTLRGVKPNRTGKKLLVGVQGEFNETAFASLSAPYNGPCGLVLNGTTQYVKVPTNAALNPGSGPLSIVTAAVFPGTNGAVHLSKGNLGTADGYGFRNNALNSFQFFVDGATTSGGPVDASWPFDGNVHVAVGTSDGATQVLYRDGAQVGSGAPVTHGAITNAVDLTVGANNGGASGFSALAPLHAWAYYDRVLTAKEALAAAGYLLGWSGYRMPGGAVAFYDLRDTRCWSGDGTAIHDLAGNALDASSVASPTLRGRPWLLSELDVLPAAL